MTPVTAYSSYQAWLADHPAIASQLRDLPPADLSRCASCLRQTTPLVILSCPSGGYALCPGCLGRDAEPRQPRTPTVIPAPQPRRPKR